jgi:hypothetical protein
MAVADLIVEDGTGLPNADSYASIVEADQYFADRPTHTLALVWTPVIDDTLTTPLDPQILLDKKTSALRIATEMLDNMYVYKIKSATDTQSLQFPIKDGTIVPINVKKATIELAARALNGELLEDNDGKEVESEKYDVVEFHYKTTGVVPQKAYTIVEAFMKKYIVSNNCYTVELCR